MTSSIQLPSFGPKSLVNLSRNLGAGSALQNSGITDLARHALSSQQSSEPSPKRLMNAIGIRGSSELPVEPIGPLYAVKSAGPIECIGRVINPAGGFLYQFIDTSYLSQSGHVEIDKWNHENFPAVITSIKQVENLIRDDWRQVAPLLGVSVVLEKGEKILYLPDAEALESNWKKLFPGKLIKVNTCQDIEGGKTFVEAWLRGEVVQSQGSEFLHDSLAHVISWFAFMFSVDQKKQQHEELTFDQLKDMMFEPLNQERLFLLRLEAIALDKKTPESIRDMIHKHIEKLWFMLSVATDQTVASPRVYQIYKPIVEIASSSSAKQKQEIMHAVFECTKSANKTLICQSPHAENRWNSYVNKELTRLDLDGQRCDLVIIKEIREELIAFTRI